MRRNRSAINEALETIAARNSDDRLPTYGRGRSRRRGGGGALRGITAPVRNHPVIASAAIVGLAIFGAKNQELVLPALKEACQSSKYCDARAAILSVPDPIESSVVFPVVAVADNPATPNSEAYTPRPNETVTGIGSYAIGGVRLKDKEIQIGVKLAFDPEKFVRANGTKPDGTPNQDHTKINTTAYIYTLCNSTNPALKAAGKADLINIVETAKDHAEALVAADAAVTPLNLKQAANGYTAEGNAPDAARKVLVFDMATDLVVYCDPVEVTAP